MIILGEPLMLRYTVWRQVGVFCIALCAFFVVAPLQAYEVSPMRIFLQPSRGQTSATIAVNNIRPEALPIEVKILRRIVNDDGTQTFEPADDQFVVFPPQAQIAASQSQAIRIQYLGAVGAESEAYVVQITEVPVNKLDGSGIQFTYNFGVAVYIQPNRPRARLGIESPVIAEGSLRFRVNNNGNDFGFINGQTLEYRVGDKKVSIDRETLTTLVENPMIRPGGSRDFVLPVDGLTDGQAVEVKLLRSDS